MVIAFVGAGGKTTVGSHIGKQLAAMGQHVLLTTTTKIFMPVGEAVYLGNPALIKAESAFMVAANRLLRGGKLEGYAVQDIAAIANLGMFDAIIVEADGAARKPVKAPSATEPVYPAALGLIIGVVGLDCIGKPVSDSYVHRAELFRRVTGAQADEPITAHHIIRLISHADGLFRHAPSTVPRVVFLNKSDTMDETTRLQAKEIERHSPYPVLLTGCDRDWFSTFHHRFIKAD